MGAVRVGRLSWSASKDKDGFRDYDISWLVRVSNPRTEGPNTAANAAGLPTIGAPWAFGADSDAWAFCRPEMTVRIHRGGQAENEPNSYWEVGQKFSNRPLNRCQDTTIENPLNEPPDIGGSFVKFTKEADRDKDGNLITTSSHEILRGPAVEFDDNRPTVTISLNSLTLPLSTFSSMVDTVNDANLWGLAKRKIKLSNTIWKRKLYGVCTFYYTMTYEFEVDFDTFDRDVGDVGTRHLDPCIVAEGIADDPDPNASGKTYRQNPENYVVYKDNNGENSRVILDGNGEPWNGVGDAPTREIKYYPESNFLLLGIPSSLT